MLHTLDFALRPQSTLYTHTVHLALHTLLLKRDTHTLICALSHFTLYTSRLDPHNFAFFTLDTVWNLGLAPLSCCVRTSTCRLELSPLAALFLPTLPKVHSGADGGPLNFPRHCALCTPHFTLHTLHSKLTRHTLHATLRTRQFTLYS